jgi:hypothetical protein
MTPPTRPSPSASSAFIDRPSRTSTLLHVRAATMSITVKGTGRQPAKDTTLSADAKFLVGVGL